MWKLTGRTGPEWARQALGDPEALLLDHAHCEKRAAGMAIGLFSRYADRSPLLIPLSQVAREELEHFEQVVALMRSRGLELRAQKPAPYAARLFAAVRSAEPGRLVDTLLCCAGIEARSCERFHLLAHATDDPALRDLFTGLLAAEARHRHLYVDLALAVAPRSEVAARAERLAACELEALREPCDGVRLHAGDVS